MSANFIAGDVWPQLTKAARSTQQRCAVAVAYFGKGASRLLPLPKGSILVVNASESAVKSGQTCPADLLAMSKRGVRVYSVANLHAKVFVLGRVVYVGSANVSRHSAQQLFEAVIRTMDAEVLSSAKQFIQQSCSDPLSRDYLRQLQALYRPPFLSSKKVAAPTHRSLRRSVSRCFLAQLERISLPNKELQPILKGRRAVKKQMRHPRSSRLQWFMDDARSVYRFGDLIIQAVHHESGKVLFVPPARVLKLMPAIREGGRATAIYLETPPQKGRMLETLVKKLGHGSKKKLLTEGLLRDYTFREALLRIWSD
ncbi:MAG: phospholipase D family protein [Candidatus Methylacidiphilales bacterium]|nr:phospholipase D family protein [Candidatus Methylacidiphilales bacterium]